MNWFQTFDTFDTCPYVLMTKNISRHLNFSTPSGFPIFNHLTVNENHGHLFSLHYLIYTVIL